MASEGSRPATGSVIALPEVASPTAGSPLAPSAPLVPSHSSLFHAFRRCWLLASVAGLLAGGAVGVSWWCAIPEQYSAEVRVRVPLPWSTADGTTASDEEIARFQRTQIALIQSATVLENALAQPEVAQLPSVEQEHDPLTWLSNHLQVSATAIPDVLVIRVHDARSEEAIRLVQAIAEVYRATLIQQRHNSLRQVREASGRTQETLQQKRGQLSQLENTRLSVAQKESQQAQFDLRVARAELAEQRKRQGATEDVVVSPETMLAVLKEDSLGSLRLKDVEQAEEEIKQLIRVSALKENDPALPEFRRRAEDAKKRLEERREELQSVAQKRERVRLLDLQQSQLRHKQERVAFLEGLVKSLDEEVQQLGGGTAADKIKSLHDEIASAQETLRHLTADRERLEQSSPPATVDQAGQLVAVRREDPKGRLRSAGLGGVGCCALVMLGVSWREMRLRRITSGSDIVGSLGLPVLGNVPAQQRRGKLTREQLDGGNRNSEAIDALRTVLLREGDRGPRLLLVTSAVDGEGKTSLAALLAASLARAWRKTLLLDADLRKPEAHNLFETPLEPGLCEVLRGEAEAAEVIQPTEISRLWMISAGHWDAHALQALAQDGAGRLFDPLKEQFDFIVIDASPILPVADALLLSTHVDAVLLAIRSGVSRSPVVQAAKQRLLALDAPVRGAVLMGTDTDLDGKAIAYPR